MHVLIDTSGLSWFMFWNMHVMNMNL